MIRIEEALKQSKPFKSPQEKVLVNLLYTHSFIKTELNAFFSIYDLTGPQFNVLRILKGAQKAISTSQIRERLLVKMSDTSRLVDRLMSKGLVVRTQCSEDKRLVDVKISKKGLKLLTKIESKKTLQSIADKLNNKESEQLSMLLDKLRS